MVYFILKNFNISAKKTKIYRYIWYIIKKTFDKKIIKVYYIGSKGRTKGSREGKKRKEKRDERARRKQPKQRPREEAYEL